MSFATSSTLPFRSVSDGIPTIGRDKAFPDPPIEPYTFAPDTGRECLEVPM
jgi:hypothetical protein